MSDTVLIAPGDHLTALTQHPDLKSALAFPDTEPLAALEAITTRRPAVVALDGGFATSARGRALINRIKADPALAGCDVRVVIRAGTAAAPVVAPAPAVPAPGPSTDGLDEHGTRAASRHRVAEGLVMLIDGNPATLVDLSVCGAQVISATALKPNQRVRVALREATGVIRFAAAVQWANFEMPKGAPCYRGGLKFIDADRDALRQYIDAHRAD